MFWLPGLPSVDLTSDYYVLTIASPLVSTLISTNARCPVYLPARGWSADCCAAVNALSRRPLASDSSFLWEHSTRRKTEVSSTTVWCRNGRPSCNNCRVESPVLVEQCGTRHQLCDWCNMRVGANTRQTCVKEVLLVCVCVCVETNNCATFTRRAGN